jgi:hypothetical protein
VVCVVCGGVCVSMVCGEWYVVVRGVLVVSVVWCVGGVCGECGVYCAVNVYVKWCECVC